LVTPVPLSPRLLLRCVSGGGSITNSTLGSAVQFIYLPFNNYSKTASLLHLVEKKVECTLYSSQILSPDWRDIDVSVRQPYARVDYIPHSGIRDLASVLYYM
jgi:hypothetical protein